MVWASRTIEDVFVFFSDLAKLNMLVRLNHYTILSGKKSVDPSYETTVHIHQLYIFVTCLSKTYVSNFDSHHLLIIQRLREL
jgi:hypothetical protein